MGGQDLAGLLRFFGGRRRPQSCGARRLLAPPPGKLQKRPAVLAEGNHPSSPARQQAQPGSCANSPSGHPLPPSGPRRPGRGPQRGAGRVSTQRPAESDAPGGVEAAAAAHPPRRPLTRTPRKHPLETDFPGDFLARGLGGVSGISVPPQTMGLPRTRSLRTSRRGQWPGGWLAQRGRGDCRADSTPRSSLGDPSPSAVELSHTSAPRPGIEYQGKAQKTPEEKNLFPVSSSRSHRPQLL